MTKQWKFFKISKTWRKLLILICLVSPSTTIELNFEGLGYTNAETCDDWLKIYIPLLSSYFNFSIKIFNPLGFWWVQYEWHSGRRPYAIGKVIVVRGCLW